MLSCFVPSYVQAEDKYLCHEASGDAQKQCALDELKSFIPKINNPRWRDQSYREFAKALIHAGEYEEAIKQVRQITNDDTKGLTLRAIGVGLNALELENATLIEIFDKLHIEANNIKHLGSKEIALTYLAIAESMSDLYDRAIQTAKEIETKSLQNKSFQEIAEVMAGKNDEEKALLALQHIENHAFQNKAYGIIAGVLIKSGNLKAAFKTIEHIDDPYIRSNALLNAVNAQAPKGDE